MSLTQDEAESLFKMKKTQVRELSLTFPEDGSKIEIELCSEDRRYNFQADINRHGHRLRKLIYQNRTGKVFVLRRLDFIGSPHSNPSNEPYDEHLKKYMNNDIPCPHVHLYIEGYNDKWAVPLADILDLKIEDTDDAYNIMENFFRYCNIDIPEFKPIGLFAWKI